MGDPRDPNLAEDDETRTTQGGDTPVEEVTSAGAVSQGTSEGPQSDEERLQVLEELYSTLEDELEGDLDQENTSGS